MIFLNSSNSDEKRSCILSQAKIIEKHESAGDRDYLFKYLRVKRQGNRSAIYSCTSTGTFFVPFIMGALSVPRKYRLLPFVTADKLACPRLKVQKQLIGRVLLKNYKQKVLT